MAPDDFVAGPPGPPRADVIAPAVAGGGYVVAWLAGGG
jgi:hypothetical protein